MNKSCLQKCHESTNKNGRDSIGEHEFKENNGVFHQTALQIHVF